MLTVRSRDRYKYFLLSHGRRMEILAWKKGKRPFPRDIYDEITLLIQRYFTGFDMVTVPAPSFHTYARGGYPIWELAKRLRIDCGLNLQKLFPHHSGKTRKHFSAWREKTVQDIRLKPGLFILVIDDIATTGNTMKVTYEAILRRGSYPCGIALA